MLFKQCISLLLLLLSTASCFTAQHQDDASSPVAPLVRKEERKSIAETEFGRISAVVIDDGIKGPYNLQFFTLEPNALFLPVLLHADMVFIVQTGNGTVSWVDEENQNQVKVKQGDIYRIRSGSVFFVTSSLDDERHNLRMCAIFTNSVGFEYSKQILSEPYSSLRDLVAGFDTKVLQAAFQVPEEVIISIKQTSQSPPIVHAPSANTTESDWTQGILELLTGGPYGINSKKKKIKTYNIMERKPDFENCNGWSKTVNRKDLSALKGSDIGVFMVNLTQGSMMGPHWNPRASEIAIVIHGQGMIRVVCSSVGNTSRCKNRRFFVKEGDVFAVPRFHPMAQMAFNNDTFVFMGFSTMARKNYPQFLAGKRSVLQTLDRDVVAASFNAPNSTIDTLLSSQAQSIILGCVSCAEEEERGMQEDIEKERQEETRRRQEEEASRRREEEEAARRREEAEAAQRQEEEAARRREEEEAARRKREEEEAARRQEEEAERRREEEEAARRQEEEAERRREEEEAARRKREEGEASQRQEEEEAARRQEEEAERGREEEKAARRQQEEEAARRREEEEAAQRQEEEAEGGREEEEAARRQQEEEAARRREEEEAARRQEEEAQAREEEQTAQEEQDRREEAARRQEEEAARRQEEEREQREREEEGQWGQEGDMEGGGGGGGYHLNRKIFL